MPFHELYIKGPRDVLDAFFQNVGQTLNANVWSLREDEFLGRHYWFFEYHGNDYPHVEVSITDKAQQENTYYVPNIVPTEIHEISREQYNQILHLFRVDVLEHYRESIEVDNLDINEVE